MRFLFAFTFALASSGLNMTSAESNCDLALFSEGFLPSHSLSEVEHKGYRTQVYAGALSLGSRLSFGEGQSIAIVSKRQAYPGTQVGAKGCSVHLQVGIAEKTQEVEVPTSALGMGAVTQVIRRLSVNWFFELQFQSGSCSEAAILQALSVFPECRWMETQRNLLSPAF